MLDGVLHIVMELAEGGDLAHAIKARGVPPDSTPLDEEEIWSVLIMCGRPRGRSPCMFLLLFAIHAMGFPVCCGLLPVPGSLFVEVCCDMKHSRQLSYGKRAEIVSALVLKSADAQHCAKVAILGKIADDIVYKMFKLVLTSFTSF